MALFNWSKSKDSSTTQTTYNQQVGVQGSGAFGASGSTNWFGKQAIGGSIYEVASGGSVVVESVDPEMALAVRDTIAHTSQTTTRLLEAVQNTNDKYAALAERAVVEASSVVKNATPTQAAELINALQAKKSDFSIPVLIAVTAVAGIVIYSVIND
jgi:hypothetical protein